MSLNQITRRELLTGAAAAALGANAAPARRPNVLFIMVDEMRWDAMSCARHPVVSTPNLDKLASQGIRFANAYTVAPVCSPARATAFTGRYADVHGVTSNGTPGQPGRDLPALHAEALRLPHGHLRQAALHARPARLRLRPVLEFQRRRSHAGNRLQRVPPEEAWLRQQVAQGGRHVPLARRRAGPRRGRVQVPRGGLRDQLAHQPLDRLPARAGQGRTSPGSSSPAI